MKKLTIKTDTETLREYVAGLLKGDFVLSDELQAKFDKIDFCRKQIEKNKAKYLIVKELQTEFSISHVAAYAIYRETDEVFDIREILIQKLRERTQIAFEAAKTKQDTLGMNKAIENEMKMIEKFYGDKETNDLENLQPVDVTIGHYPELMNKEVVNPVLLKARIQKLLQKREKEILALNENNNEMDTDFEEIG